MHFLIIPAFHLLNLVIADGEKDESNDEKGGYRCYYCRSCIHGHHMFDRSGGSADGHVYNSTADTLVRAPQPQALIQITHTQE